MIPFFSVDSAYRNAVAVYHFSMKTISRGSGRSVTAAAAYRSATRIHDSRTGQAHDYSSKRGVLSTTILAPSRSPDWARDPEQLWNEVELNEKRKDARLARENIVALPHELDLDQNKSWLHLFVNDHYVKRGMVAQVSIHAADRDGDNRNVHAHILLTDRQVTRNGFKEKKARSWNEKPTLQHWRKAFAEYQNRALEAAGHRARVDHRSFKDRGIDREPTQHQGPAATKVQQQSQPSLIAEKNQLTAKFNEHLTAMKEQAKQMQLQVEEERQRIAAKARALQSNLNDRYMKLRKERELREAELEAEKKDTLLGRLFKQKEAANEKEQRLRQELKAIEIRLGQEQKDLQPKSEVIAKRPNSEKTMRGDFRRAADPDKFPIEIRASREVSGPNPDVPPIPGCKKERCGRNLSDEHESPRKASEQQPSISNSGVLSEKEEPQNEIVRQRLVEFRARMQKSRAQRTRDSGRSR